MREILFRGKDKHTGEWVSGHFYTTPYAGNDNKTLNCHFISNPNSYGSNMVLPETVGEFTGLRDTTGLLIFEGDILKIAKRSDSAGRYYHPPIDYPVNVVVKWDHCGWMWETLCEDKRYIGFPEAWGHYLCEVIGNIHDNPELLGGTEHE